MAFTTLSDVAEGYQDEMPNSGYVMAQINEVELILRSKLGDLTAWATTDLRQDAIRTVVGRAVRRVLRNPEGYTSETDGDYSYRRDPRVASGTLWVTDDDWELLGISKVRVGTIRLATSVRRRR